MKFDLLRGKKVSRILQKLKSEFPRFLAPRHFMFDLLISATHVDSKYLSIPEAAALFLKALEDETKLTNASRSHFSKSVKPEGYKTLFSSGGISVFPAKTAAQVIYGGVSNLCIAKDMLLFYNPTFMIFNIVHNFLLKGFILTHLKGQNIIIAGIEPKPSFLHAYGSAEECFNHSVEAIIFFAKQNGYKNVKLMVHPAAISNRETLKNYIKKQTQHFKVTKASNPFYLGKPENGKPYYGENLITLWRA